MSRPSRLARLPAREVLGLHVPVAVGLRARLLGLALLPRRRAGPGLLIPRCRSVHTFGMRFPLEVIFLDRELREIRRVARVRPNRVAGERRACAILELPADPPR